MSTAQPAYPQTPRTTPTRLRERASHDEAAIHAVLDEALVCHLGVVVDGEPLVLPTIHTRVGRVLYLHMSTGAHVVRLARAATASGEGLPVCVTVTLVDALVLARSQFHHSMNYRSVVVRGHGTLVDDPAELALALSAVVEHVAPGRSARTRPGDAKEVAATAVLRVPLEEASLKSRSGPPGDDDEDLTGPYWAGLLAVRTVFGGVTPAPDLQDGIAVPEHVSGYVRPSGPGD